MRRLIARHQMPLVGALQSHRMHKRRRGARVFFEWCIEVALERQGVVLGITCHRDGGDVGGGTTHRSRMHAVISRIGLMRMRGRCTSCSTHGGRHVHSLSVYKNILLFCYAVSGVEHERCWVIVAINYVLRARVCECEAGCQSRKKSVLRNDKLLCTRNCMFSNYACLTCTFELSERHIATS